MKMNRIFSFSIYPINVNPSVSHGLFSFRSVVVSRTSILSTIHPFSDFPFSRKLSSTEKGKKKISSEMGKEEKTKISSKIGQEEKTKISSDLGKEEKTKTITKIKKVPGETGKNTVPRETVDTEKKKPSQNLDPVKSEKVEKKMKKSTVPVENVNKEIPEERNVISEERKKLEEQILKIEKQISKIDNKEENENTIRKLHQEKDEVKRKYLMLNWKLENKDLENHRQMTKGEVASFVKKRAANNKKIENEVLCQNHKFIQRVDAHYNWKPLELSAEEIEMLYIEQKPRGLRTTTRMRKLDAEDERQMMISRARILVREFLKNRLFSEEEIDYLEVFMEKESDLFQGQLVSNNMVSHFFALQRNAKNIEKIFLKIGEKHENILAIENLIKNYYQKNLKKDEVPEEERKKIFSKIHIYLPEILNPQKCTSQEIHEGNVNAVIELALFGWNLVDKRMMNNLIFIRKVVLGFYDTLLTQQEKTQFILEKKLLRIERYIKIAEYHYFTGFKEAEEFRIIQLIKDAERDIFLKNKLISKATLVKIPAKYKNIYNINY